MVVVACQPASDGASAPDSPAPATAVAPVEASERREPSGGRAGPLPAADSLEAYGVPAPPSEWPAPVPTLYVDGAASLRGLSLTVDDYRGQVIRVRALVRAVGDGESCLDERCGVGLLLVDRSIDDPGSETRALVVGGVAPKVDERVQLLARVAMQDPVTVMLDVLAVAPDPDPVAAGNIPSWQPITGDVASLPIPHEPPTLLRDGARPVVVELAESVDEALFRANLAALADDGQVAELHIRRAVTLAPEDPEPWAWLEEVYGGYAQFDHQLATLAAATVQCPDELGFWFEWGQRAVEAGRFADAIAPLEHVVAAKPDSIPALFYLGTAHWLAGDLELAKPYYERVIVVHEARPVHTANEVQMIMTADNRLAELGGKGH